MREGTKIRWVGLAVSSLMIAIGEWHAAVAWMSFSMGLSLVVKERHEN